MQDLKCILVSFSVSVSLRDGRKKYKFSLKKEEAHSSHPQVVMFFYPIHPTGTGIPLYNSLTCPDMVCNSKD